MLEETTFQAGSAVSVQNIQQSIIRSLEASHREEAPNRHWYLHQVLPEDTCRDVVALPVEPPRIDDTQGKRETHNSSRRFFNREANERFDACRETAETFQSPEVVGAIERFFDVDLANTNLRIEHCLDTDGFWLAPHTDLGVKKFTMLLYLSTDPGHEDWGTDVYADADTLAETAPAEFNSALVFVPSNNTWHGFHKRPITGLRRSLIINYVTQDWCARHELSFPEQPVSA
ncbi:2OG-Fe(II) oxygenase [Thioalkalivibrio sulfidiphilus]|uniref:2OG-Fe(II) oxygenase n=1 Tax=Thioalkalivibrio sulfidiphilus TaxID=1033854 RepID=UPI003B304010